MFKHTMLKNIESVKCIFLLQIHFFVPNITLFVSTKIKRAIFLKDTGSSIKLCECRT